MDASAWIAFAGLAFLMAVQIAVSAFVMGGLFQRVKSLEEGAPAVIAMVTAIAKLEAAVGTLTTRFDDSLSWLQTIDGYEAKPPTPKARRKP